ncbi:hypothetical protein GRF29_1g930039 [Pseudopithomyces chartarum]|uniref:SGNH hydrolase-type esterase domain-containing protein n=1 Tax=Pseudopithomyces chartarum TaxID=1892770 RepID=A0AAN6M6N8_9PLEO|nr:hypothetical protein GRF29_1g930039 [Pseudopithomyces chartarum]
MRRVTHFIAVALISLLAIVGAQHALSAMIASRDDDPIVPGHSNFPLRILPLGASITWGQKSSDGNGYRGHLRDMLQKRSTVVDMVGTMKSGNMPDNDNEGHPGVRLDQVAVWAKQDIKFLPSLILINVGTNDVLFESPQFPLSEIGERMDNLVTYLFNSIPDVTIVVSKLLPSSNKDADDRIRNIVNPQYEDVVINHQKDKQRIVLADLYSALTVEDLVDGIHPTDEGYKKLADVWLSAIYEAGKKGMLVEPKGALPTIDVPSNSARTTVSATESETQQETSIMDNVFAQDGQVKNTRTKMSNAVRSKQAIWLTWWL